MKRESPILSLSYLFLSLFLLSSFGHSGEYFANIPLSEAINVNPWGAFNHLKASELPEGPGPFLLEYPAKKKHLRDTVHARVKLRALFCKAENPKALLLGVHGLQSNHRWYKGTCEYLAKNGVSALFYDRRGSGLSEGVPRAKLAVGKLVGREFDINPQVVKDAAPGLRGHVKTGFLLQRTFPRRMSMAAHFMIDIDVSHNTLTSLYAGENLPVHVFANCFGSRIAVPFVQKMRGQVASMIITAPATDMQSRADFKSFFTKMSIATPPIPLVGHYEYYRTPLQDDFFVPSSSLAYQEMGDDSLSLSLRAVTSDFLWGANILTKRMLGDLETMETPLFVALASGDKIVDNEAIKKRLLEGTTKGSGQHYKGDLKLVTFESPHMIEFSQAKDSFQQSLLQWIEDVDLGEENPASRSYADFGSVIAEDDNSERETLPVNPPKRKSRSSFFKYKK